MYKTITFPLLALSLHGGNRVLIELANQLANSNYDVEIIIPKGNYFTSYEINKNIRIIEAGVDLKIRKLNYIFFLFYFIFRLPRKFIIANYFLTVPAAYFASRFLGGKYIFIVQDLEYLFFKQPFRFFFKKIFKWCIDKGQLISANPYLTQQIKSLYKHSPNLEINIGPSDNFFIKPMTSTYKKYDIIYFLRDDPHKRIDLFDKFLEINNRKYNILGVTQNLKLKDKYKKHLEVVIPKNDLELIDLFDQSKILILTSQHEGFSLPPLEGMARGVPPVLFECGGPSTYCKNNYNSILIQFGAISELFIKADSLLSNCASLTRISQNAIETARHFNLRKGVEDLISKINQLQ